MLPLAQFREIPPLSQAACFGTLVVVFIVALILVMWLAARKH
jgi:hypothetical protein